MRKRGPSRNSGAVAGEGSGEPARALLRNAQQSPTRSFPFDHVVRSTMVFLRQFWALWKKNWIVLSKHWVLVRPALLTGLLHALTSRVVLRTCCDALFCSSRSASSSVRALRCGLRSADRAAGVAQVFLIKPNNVRRCVASDVRLLTARTARSGHYSPHTASRLRLRPVLASHLGRRVQRHGQQSERAASRRPHNARLFRQATRERDPDRQRTGRRRAVPAELPAVQRVLRRGHLQWPA